MNRAYPVVLGAVLYGVGFFVWQFREAWDVATYWQFHVDGTKQGLLWLKSLTDLGAAATMVPVGLVAFGRLALTGRSARAAWLFATIGSGRLLIEALKAICARPRPAAADRLVSVSTASFPSSHSAGAMLTMLAIGTAFEWGPSGFLAGVAFAFAVGVTRVALGVHWPSDVVAGLGLGLLWVSLASRTLPRTARATIGGWLIDVRSQGSSSALLPQIAAALTMVACLELFRLEPGPGEIRRLSAFDARQGVAVGPSGLYAIGNDVVARLRADNGRVIARNRIRVGDLDHLNSCVVAGRVLVCAISNYPHLPMKSAVVWLDAVSLQPTRALTLRGAPGSLTWVAPEGGDWWACFANYDALAPSTGRDHRATTIVRFDRAWRLRDSFALPETLLKRVAPFSLSGGAWVSKGRLLVTGHERPEIYVLQVPNVGRTLRLVATIPSTSHGQAIASDPNVPGMIWSIERSRRLLLETRIDQSHRH